MRTTPSKIQDFVSGRRLTGEQHRFIEAMGDSNIPVTYWELPMSKFTGSEEIKNAVTDYGCSLQANYKQGRGLCFAGPYGIGKTYGMCSLLKAAIKSKYTAYYTSLTDMALYIGSRNTKEEYLTRCMKSDFLAFDEVDARHVPTSQEGLAFFGSSVEKIIRERVQNKLPTFFATNHDSLDPVFSGQYNRAILSLLSTCCTTIVAIGRDFRKGGN